MNFLETGQKPTWLGIKTSGGDTFILGTHSRYNVPYSSQKQYLTEDTLLLAHGTQKPSVLRKGLAKDSSFVVEASATKRGAAQGLYVQPPIGVKDSPGYVGLTYVGFKSSSSSEVVMASSSPKRTAFIFKESPTKLSITPKTIAGTESELIIPPGSEVGTTARAEVFSIGLKKVYIQPSKILTEGSSSGSIGAISELSGYTSYIPSSITTTYGISNIKPTSSSIILPVASQIEETPKGSSKLIQKSVIKPSMASSSIGSYSSMISSTSRTSSSKPSYPSTSTELSSSSKSYITKESKINLISKLKSIYSSSSNKIIERETHAPIYTYPSKPIPISLGKALSQVKKSIAKDEGMFEIFTTKAGKDISIGKAKTQEEAELLLKGTLTKTLRAGGFLTKGGKKVRATELKTFGGGEFRLSKASPYKIIEKKGKRLRRKTTGRQIQFFRK